MPQHPKPNTPSDKVKSPQYKDKLAEALRANLRRRKEQAQGRQEEKETD